MVKRRLPELTELEHLAEICRGIATVRVEGEVRHGAKAFPLLSFVFGTEDRSAPTVAFVAGVHGLERIGTVVALSQLRTVVELLAWDKGLQHQLRNARMVFYPLVNPGGMFSLTRSNPRGIDLMRNAPLDAERKPNVPFVGGHRLSKRLPWFRGSEGEAMEPEAKVLLDFIRREVFPSRFAITLDLHSGFGLVDRLWFPYAHSRRPFDELEAMFALKTRLDRSLPNHFYLTEPQSLKYVTHGDLWDYMYIEHRREARGRVFLPLTLEMGSWLWIKKNPRQILSSLGIFNPVLPHRIQRTLRRHLALLDFLFRATVSHENWLPPERVSGGTLRDQALRLWYGGASGSVSAARGVRIPNE